MGLDWIVENKPKLGCELQYNTLLELFKQASSQLDDLNENSPEYELALTYFRGIKQQLDSVTVTKYDTSKTLKFAHQKI